MFTEFYTIYGNCTLFKLLTFNFNLQTLKNTYFARIHSRSCFCMYWHLQANKQKKYGYYKRKSFIKIMPNLNDNELAKCTFHILQFKI